MLQVYTFGMPTQVYETQLPDWPLAQCHRLLGQAVSRTSSACGTPQFWGGQF